MIRFVSATRMSREEFWDKSALGRSLLRLEAPEPDRLAARITFENRRGLPAVFNEQIDAAGNDDILVFLHDDVWIDDLFVCDQLEQALKEFQVVGVAGNVRRTAYQPAWAFTRNDREIDWDDRTKLRGAIAHGAQPCGSIVRYGPTRQECELLDGVFLAARRATLGESRLRFDPRFAFHFYDMDFCRSAREKGLRLGCWPIALTHQSPGAYGTPPWDAGYAAYLAKWKE